jgi:branched-chain amino acid transport system permease protein
MVVLGGMSRFYGPILGAFLLLWLNQEITALTEYWSLIVGLSLMALIFFLPGGVADLVERFRRLWASRFGRAGGAPAAPRTGAP